ncbi:MAG: TIGR00341 family protein [Trichlorobacter sp.]
MTSAQIRYYTKKLKDYLALKTEMVSHQAIIKEVASGVERSWVYYLMLLMSGLIALLGLLTNSVAVVIGAMLISPLMGPIISSGLALTIGDLPLARRAFRTIAVSVVLTVLVTALMTLLSPLKEPNSEILGRVRPNIYDLFIAVLSGIVGAVALCTKRNYLITATGVAVATAVIPPLSVAGYGLGTGQLMLGMGGFLLFFTNFVAIVLTSDLVFFIMGFRTSHVKTIQYSQRTRLLVIGGLLTLISIPLVYTLVVDIRKVNAKKRIERVLKKHLNQQHASRMTGYTYQSRKNELQIRATVNTVRVIPQAVGKKIEQDLQADFKAPVNLYLEQVLVASERLPEQVETSQPREESPTEVQAKVARLVNQAERELTTLLAPFPVRNVRLSFATQAQPLGLSAVVRRDWPVNEDELLQLTRQLEKALQLPLIASFRTAPLLPTLLLDDDGSLARESQQALSLIAQLPGGVSGYRLHLEASGRNDRLLATVVRRHLTTSLGVPESSISTQYKRNTARQPKATLRIVRR